MLLEDRDIAYIWDMLDAAKAISEFVRNKAFHDYLNDRLLRGGVERNLEIIGEAAGKVSKSFREANPDVPWTKIISQRNVLIHEYGEIEHELIWKVVTIHIPELIAKLQLLIP